MHFFAPWAASVAFALCFGVGVVGVVVRILFDRECCFFLLGFVFRCFVCGFSTESLILAQDERWRRA